MATVDSTHGPRTGTDTDSQDDRFRGAVASMLDGFAIFSAVRDDDGQIVDFRYEYINDRGAAMNERPVEDHLGRTILGLLPAHESAGLVEAYAQVVDTGEPLEIESLDYTDTYGSGRTLARAFNVRATRLGDGFAVTWRDITDRRRAEEDLRMLNDQLRQANEDLDRFAGIASHDLRSPALLMGGLVETVLAHADDTLGARERDLLERAVQQSRHMVTLIDDLLSFTQLGNGHAAPEPCELDEALAAALETLTPLLDETGARISTVPLPRVLLGGPEAARTLLHNLVENACKYTPQGHRPSITISAVRDGAWWEVTVADEGIGVEPHDRDRIFDAFERAAPTVARGTGLGLSICERIVARVGGRIWTEDNEPRGSRFVVRVPVPPDAGGPTASRMPRHRRPRSLGSPEAGT